MSLLPEDDEEAMVRKLKRVVALVEGEQGGMPGRIAPVMAGVETYPAGLQPATGNGWATPAPVTAPELPEDRQGDWELIKPGEDA
ncbi:hypothetical protein ACWC0A_30600 [Streptomyces scopuliridis]